MMRFPFQVNHSLKMLLICGLISGLTLLSAQQAKAQDSAQNQTQQFLNQYPDLDTFRVDTIIVKGNEITNRKIILRELKFQSGDRLPLARLEEYLEQHQQLVMNTQLFIKVALFPEWQSQGLAKLTIEVNERWYTFPSPVFKLADRNFNEWWVNRGRDLSRTVYGLKFYQENIRGRNEQLKASFTLGFTEQFGFQYTFPFIDSSQTWGLQLGSNFTQNKQTSYKAEDNNLLFHFDDQYIRRKFNASARLTRRKNIRKRHFLEFSFHSNWAGRELTNRNPNYFGKDRNVIRYLTLRYQYKEDYRDRINYPKKGYLMQMGLQQNGLGIFKDVNQTFLTGKYHKFWPLGKKFFLASGLEGLYSFSSTHSFQPYFLRRGLGFGQSFVRGYEYDVILGNNYLLNRNSLRYQLFDTEINNLNFIPFEQFRKIPLGLYFKVYADQGYVTDLKSRNPEAPLKNTYLVGGGAGLDVVTYYDIVLRLEYSFKKNLENDLFLHFVKAF